MIGLVIKGVKYMLYLMLILNTFVWSIYFISQGISPSEKARVSNGVFVYSPFIFSTGLFPILCVVFLSYCLREKIIKSVLYTGVVIMAFLYLYPKLESSFSIQENYPLLSIGYITFYLNLIFIISIFLTYRKRGNSFMSFSFSQFDFKNIYSILQKKKKISIVLKAKPRTIKIESPERGIYIQGGAGSGKTESLIKPIIKQSVENNSSGICYDFKSPELTHYLINLINKSSGNVKPYIVDFKNPLSSHRVNPISPKYLKKIAYASEFVEALMNNLSPSSIKNKEWYDREAQNLLTGIIWYVKKYYPQYCSLPHIISLILNNNIVEIILEVSKDHETRGMVVSVKQAIELKAEKQLSAIISTLQGNLAKLNTSEIFWLLSGDDFDLNINDPDNPKFLCIGNDSTLPTVYTPVISLIISVATRLMNEPNKHHSIIILDEAPTIYIPNFEKIPATARSNKVSTVFCGQDYSMLVDSYGEQKAQVIISNLGNQFYGRSSNTKTATMIKNIFSKQDKIYAVNSKSSGESGDLFSLNTNSSRSKGQSIQERDRVKISDILNASPGEMFGIIAEGKPREFIGYKLGYDKSKYKSLDLSKIVKEVSQQELDSNFDWIISQSRNILRSSSKPSESDPLFD